MKEERFWSLEINNISDKKEFNDLSAILVMDNSLENYIRLITEFPGNDYTPMSDIFIFSPYVNEISSDDTEAISNLSSIYLMLKGVVALYSNNISRSRSRSNKFYNHHKHPDGMLWDRSNEIIYNKDIIYKYPFNPCEKIRSNYLDVFILKIINTAMNNRELFEILMQFGFDDSWGRLYSIWDSVYFSVKKIKGLKNKKEVSIFLGLNYDEISRFQGCANSYGLLFLEARHGEQGWGIPSETITREDAIELTKKIILNYIEYIAR